jgi:hypothetical protein
MRLTKMASFIDSHLRRKLRLIPVNCRLQPRPQLSQKAVRSDSKLFKIIGSSTGAVEVAGSKTALEQFLKVLCCFGCPGDDSTPLYWIIGPV